MNRRDWRWTIVAPWLLAVGLFVALLGSATVAGQHPDFGGGGSAEVVAFAGLIGLALAISAIGLGIIAAEAIVIHRPTDAIGLTINVFAGAVVPVAIGVAIPRYHLYDIDRIISRTIAYAIVSAILALVFAGVVVLSSTALASFAQGQTIAVAASTLTAFIAYQPVLRRVRRNVDQRFDRARYDAEQTVAGFSARLRDEVDIATVTTDLRSTVQGAVNPASLGLWIREARP